MPMKPLDHDLRLVFEKRLKNAQFGLSGKKVDLFCLNWWRRWTTSKTLCFFFSSYRTVNVVPFYLAVFSILCCYNT